MNFKVWHNYKYLTNINWEKEKDGMTHYKLTFL